jgi:hypothetical protein
MPLAGFEPTVPVFKRAKTFHALDRAATVTGFVQAYRGLKSFSSFLENVRLSVPTRHVRDFSTFSVFPNKHCRSARCAYAANVVGKELDIHVFADGAVSLYYIL